jgi:hypothetical protein
MATPGAAQNRYALSKNGSSQLVLVESGGG